MNDNADAGKMVDTVVFDVGSTFTKVAAFAWNDGEYHWLDRAQAPTTVADIDLGLIQANEQLAENLGVKTVVGREVLATSSAAGGLRMVAMGYMPRVTAKAAKEVAMNAGARVLEVMSFEDPPENKREMLCEIRPDIILLRRWYRWRRCGLHAGGCRNYPQQSGAGHGSHCRQYRCSVRGGGFVAGGGHGDGASSECDAQYP